ncbi:unnamed protein product, partial [Mesorhabditis belari]|uniref:Immunoglobulin domain-containing protein n=1 Tax=Mesorhabditis belari TaxID=2138241 RepID=A0AAF3F118_9BILA
MKLSILMIFFYSKALFGQNLGNFDDELIELDRKSSEKNVIRTVGGSVRLLCPGPAYSREWVYPTATNAHLVGYDSGEALKRMDSERSEEIEGVILNIYNLTSTDTGSYGCRDPTTGKANTTYLYVKARNVFLKRKDDVLFETGREKSRYDNWIPCRTIKPVNREKLYLFVDGVKWAEMCLFVIYPLSSYGYCIIQESEAQSMELQRLN